MDVFIRNQDIKKLETTCFGLTLAIFRFYLEKLFCKIFIQLCKRASVLSTQSPMCVCIIVFKMKP